MQAEAVIGLLLANIGAMAASYVSIRVAIAELKVSMKRAEKDIDNLGRILGTKKSKGEEE